MNLKYFLNFRKKIMSHIPKYIKLLKRHISSSHINSQKVDLHGKWAEIVDIFYD